MKCRYIITLILFPISFLNAMIVTIPSKDILAKRFNENNLCNENNQERRNALIEKLAEQKITLLQVLKEVEGAGDTLRTKDKLVKALLCDNPEAVLEAYTLLRIR